MLFWKDDTNDLGKINIHIQGNKYTLEPVVSSSTDLLIGEYHQADTGALVHDWITVSVSDLDDFDSPQCDMSNRHSDDEKRVTN